MKSDLTSLVGLAVGQVLWKRLANTGGHKMRITRTLSKQQSPIFLFLVLSWTLLKCLCSVPAAEAYFLVIDAHGEECFFDRVSATTKLGLTFEVVEGGFLDIDVTITGK